MIDLDNTLIYTDKANFLSYRAAIKEIKKIDLELIYNKNIRFTKNDLFTVLPNLKLNEYNDIINIKRNIYSKYLSTNTLNIPILNILQKYANSNIISLVTNSSKNRAISILDFFKILDLFDYQFFKENYDGNVQSKFQYAWEYVGVDPKNVIIFENDISEINKVIQAGLPKQNIGGI